MGCKLSTFLKARGINQPQLTDSLLSDQVCALCGTAANREACPKHLFCEKCYQIMVKGGECLACFPVDEEGKQIVWEPEKTRQYHI